MAACLPHVANLASLDPSTAFGGPPPPARRGRIFCPRFSSQLSVASASPSAKLAIFRRFRYSPGVTDHALPHDFPIGIDPADIDFMGHVNNASYLKWVQDAVLSHWQKIAPADAVASLLWVALKHEITYRKPTFLDDEVIATVLLEKVQGARAFYQTVIRRGEDVLAEVKSSWCCIDAATLKPARLASSVIERFFPKGD